MAVEVKFGNLGIDAIERDLGIKFTEEDRKLLRETRQETVMEGNEKVDMPSRSWHFFDIPRQLELGSYGFFLEIRKMLSRYELKGKLDVNFVFSDEEKPEKLYKLRTIEGFPVFLYGTKTEVIAGSTFTHPCFYQLYKENKKTIVYKEVGTLKFFAEVKELDMYVPRDFLVPKEGDYKWREVKLTKDELLNPSDKNTILFENSFDICRVKPWNGERLFYIDREYWKLKYSDLKEELKGYKKYLKELKAKMQ
jgi:hypothetical protein